MIFMTDWHGSTYCSLIIGGARLMHGLFSKILGGPGPPGPPGSMPLIRCTDRLIWSIHDPFTLGYTRQHISRQNHILVTITHYSTIESDKRIIVLFSERRNLQLDPVGFDCISAERLETGQSPPLQTRPTVQLLWWRPVPQYQIRLSQLYQDYLHYI